ncbi:hypothetical protein ACTWKA_00735 [Bacillus sp. 3A_MP1]
MPKSHFYPHVKEMMGKDFAELLREIAPFVEPRADLIKTNHRLTITIDVAGARAGICQSAKRIAHSSLKERLPPADGRGTRVDRQRTVLRPLQTGDRHSRRV